MNSNNKSEKLSNQSKDINSCKKVNVDISNELIYDAEKLGIDWIDEEIKKFKDTDSK